MGMMGPPLQLASEMARLSLPVMLAGFMLLIWTGLRHRRVNGLGLGVVLCGFVLANAPLIADSWLITLGPLGFLAFGWIVVRALQARPDVTIGTPAPRETVGGHVATATRNRDHDEMG